MPNPIPAAPLVSRALAVVIVERTDLGDQRFTSTGFIVASDSKRSYLLTAYHVMCDEYQKHCLNKSSTIPGLLCSEAALPAPSTDQLLTVRLHTDPTTKLTACVENFGTLDEDNDLLLLRVDRPNLQYLSIARTVMTGWPVAAAGYAAGILEPPTYQPGPPEVPQGTVTWTDTEDPSTQAPQRLRDGVATSPGDSGGPLFDMAKGYVVGAVSRQVDNAYLAVGPAPMIRICNVPDVHIQVANLSFAQPAGPVESAQTQTNGGQPSAGNTSYQSVATGVVVPPPPASIGSQYALATGTDPQSQYQTALYYADMGDEASAYSHMQGAAAAGYAPAQAYVGVEYELGLGVPVDFDQAVHWYGLAAAAGNYNGQRHLGNWYRQANKADEARTWYTLAYASLQKAAAGGDARAQYWLGVFLESDAYGLTPDPTASLKWLQQAADKESDALVEIGWAYFFGRGVANNPQLAADTFLRAVGKGNTDAAYALAYMCTHADPSKPDYRCASQWASSVADRNGRAADDLGWMYEYGHGVQTDYGQALKWYKRAVALGETDAYDDIGNMYYYGHVGTTHDYVQARAWFAQGAAYGDDRAEYDLGELYDDARGVDHRDMDLAAHWYKLSADQGNTNAMEGLADIYYDKAGYAEDHARTGDVQAFYAQSFALFKQAADLGEAYAEYSVGFMYEKGQGTTRDYAQALKWLAAASQQEDVQAEYELALMNERGLGTPADPNAAFSLYRQAADNGLAKAQNRVGEAYARFGSWNTTGFDRVPKDYKEALAWFTLAAEQGDADGLANLGTMYLRGYGAAQDYVQAGAYLKLSIIVDTPYRTSKSAQVKSELAETLRHASNDQIVAFAARWASNNKSLLQHLKQD